MIKKIQLGTGIKICLYLSLLFSCSQENSKRGNEPIKNVNQDTIIGDVRIIYRNDSIIQFLTSPDGKDRMHQIVSDTLGNVLFDEGTYFSVFLENSLEFDFEIVLSSINYPNTVKNFIVWGGSFKNQSERTHISQWYSNSYRDTFAFSIPDNLIGKIDFLQYCIVYYNPEEDDGEEMPDFKVDECSTFYTLKQ
jgi:hypothetical protein